MASDGEAIIGLWFDGQQYVPDVLDQEHQERLLPVFEATCRWLGIYFSGKEPDFTPPLSLRTTRFRKRVWQTLLSIPYGKTMTYGEIADKLAAESERGRMSAQASSPCRMARDSSSWLTPAVRGYTGTMRPVLA